MSKIYNIKNNDKMNKWYFDNKSKVIYIKNIKTNKNIKFNIENYAIDLAGDSVFNLNKTKCLKKEIVEFTLNAIDIKFDTDYLITFKRILKQSVSELT